MYKYFLSKNYTEKVTGGKENSLKLSISISGLLGVSNGKESACNAGNMGLTPGPGRFPGEDNGYPFQYSCLENPMDRGAWWATVSGVTESDMTE